MNIFRLSNECDNYGDTNYQDFIYQGNSVDVSILMDVSFECSCGTTKTFFLEEEV